MGRCLHDRFVGDGMGCDPLGFGAGFAEDVDENSGDEILAVLFWVAADVGELEDVVRGEGGEIGFRGGG